jgi:IS5 family transposase
LRLLYLKHRYQLGYETLCRAVADSLSWRRFCRIPQTSPAPHPTTLVELVRRSGPQAIEQLNAALLGKLVEDRLMRCECVHRSDPGPEGKAQAHLFRPAGGLRL